MIVAAAAAIGILVGWPLTRAVDHEAATRRFHAAVVGCTGLLFALAAWRFGATWELPAYLYFAALSTALGFVDLQTHRLPNPWTLSAYPITLALLLLPALAEQRWTDLWRAVLGGAALFAVFAVLHLINPAGMGLGDVKLAGSMGMLLGWLSWSALAVGAFLGFVLGAVVGLILMAAGRAGRKSALPFGPFMLIGSWVAIVLYGAAG